MEEILRSLPDPMKINETTLIIATIFLVLIAILNSFVFKPLIGILEKRNRLIVEGEETAKKFLQMVEEKEAEYKNAKIATRKKNQSDLQDLLKETTMACDETIASAREKAMAQVQAAATELDGQVGSAKDALRQDAQTIAQQIVSSVLSRKTA